MTPMTVPSALALLVAVTFLIGCGSDYPTAETAKSAPAGTARAATPAAPAKSTPVRVVPAMEERAAGVVVASGTLAAEEQVVLGIKVAGRLAELAVDLGSRVAQGEVLARLDPDRLRAARRSRPRPRCSRRARGSACRRTARATRSTPTKTASCARRRRCSTRRGCTPRPARKLCEQQLIARAELDAAEAALPGRRERATRTRSRRCATARALLAQRRSELELARQQLADSVLRAPFDGAVRERQRRGRRVPRRRRAGRDARADPPAAAAARGARARGGQRPRRARRCASRVEGDPTAYDGPRRAPQPGDRASRTARCMVEAEVPNARRRAAAGRVRERRDRDRSRTRRPCSCRPSALVTFAGIDKVLVRRGRQGGREARARPAAARATGSRSLDGPRRPASGRGRRARQPRGRPAGRSR